MRGVCALNLEAMSMFHNEDGSGSYTMMFHPNLKITKKKRLTSYFQLFDILIFQNFSPVT